MQRLDPGWVFTSMPALNAHGGQQRGIFCDKRDKLRVRRFEFFHGLFQCVHKRLEKFWAFLPASRFGRRSLNQSSDALGILLVRL